MLRLWNCDIIYALLILVSLVVLSSMCWLHCILDSLSNVWMCELVFAYHLYDRRTMPKFLIAWNISSVFQVVNRDFKRDFYVRVIVQNFVLRRDL